MPTKVKKSAKSTSAAEKEIPRAITVDQKSVHRLTQELENFSKDYTRRHAQNYHLNWILVLVSLFLATSIVIVGVRKGENAASVAATLAALNGLVIAIQSAFAPGKLAEFYRVIAGTANRLKLELEVNVQTKSQFDEVFSAFTRLYDRADADIPHGDGKGVRKDALIAGEAPRVQP